MDIKIFNNIHFQIQYPNSTIRRRGHLDSYIPDRGYVYDMDNIKIIYGIFLEIGLDHFANFLFELSRQRGIEDKTELLNFLSFNMTDVINRGIIYANALNNPLDYWRNLSSAYSHKLREHFINRLG